LDQPGLVGAQVAEHQVHLEVGRDARLDGVEEGPELPGAVPRPALADHRPGLRVEGGEQVERAVPAPVVGPALGLPGAHRQHRRGPLDGPDLLGWMAPSRHRGAKVVAVEGHQRGAIRHGGYDDRP
jgi:hypothetical protein